MGSKTKKYIPGLKTLSTAASMLLVSLAYVLLHWPLTELLAWLETAVLVGLTQLRE